MKCNRSLPGALVCLTAAASLTVAVSLVVPGGLTATVWGAEEAGNELVSLIVGLLGEKDKDLRAVGLDQIRSEAKGEAATRQFAAQLPKLPAEAQAGLLSALADRGDEAARPAVIDVLNATPDETVKLAALGAIGALGDASNLPLLLPFLSTGSKAEKSAARSALVRLRGDGVPGAMVATLKQSTDSPLRVTLIEILAKRRALETLPDLLALAVDSDALVRSAAMAAQGQLAGPAQIPGMLEGVLKAAKGAERDAAERAVAQVCGRGANGAQRAAPLLAAMAQLNPADRAALLSTLGRVGGPAALSTIETAMADPAQHETGLRALCNWPDASVAPRLIEVFQTDEHPKHRGLALAALIRIAPLPDGRPEAQRLELLKKVMAMCDRTEDQNLALKRARAIYTVETLRFVVPYLDQPDHAQSACETVVELAHHRDVRDANKADFTPALDKVLALSKDPVVRDRAERYQAGKTWVRPKDEESSP
jgi:HEAT repeat protein